MRLRILVFQRIGSAKTTIPITTGSEIQVGGFDVQVSFEIKPEVAPEESTEPANESTVAEMDAEEEGVESPNRSQRARSDSPSYSPDTSVVSSPSSIQTKIFEAIYGKASATRVHKLYPKDGTIEVRGLSVQLMDSKGKVVTN